MIAIGVDPGTLKTGYGILRRDGSRYTCLASGTIKMSSKNLLEDRLVVLYDKLHEVLLTHGPDEAAVEDLFFAKNAMSSLKLGHARGVILLALKKHGLVPASYAPALVKRSVVGAGRAQKGQVARVVKSMLGLTDSLQEDEADALAIAICHLNAPRISR